MAEEAEGYGYESEESLLKIEEITAINGSGKQLTANITFLIDERYNEQLVHQLIGHWCYLQRYQSQKFSSATAN